MWDSIKAYVRVYFRWPLMTKKQYESVLDQYDGIIDEMSGQLEVSLDRIDVLTRKVDSYRQTIDYLTEVTKGHEQTIDFLHGVDRSKPRVDTVPLPVLSLEDAKDIARMEGEGGTDPEVYRNAQAS